MSDSGTLGTSVSDVVLYGCLCSSSKGLLEPEYVFGFPSHLLDCRIPERCFSLLPMFRSLHELFLNHDPNILILDTAFFSGES